YLICSDELSGVVSEETIGQTLREYPDPHDCVERLISLALRGGGPDNVSVIVADATDENILEGTPLVGGAAARGGDTEENLPESTPAARASALNPRPAAPAAEPEETEPESPQRPRRRPVRSGLLTVLVLA